MSVEPDVLAEVLRRGNFVHQLLVSDELDDWALAADLGRFLIAVAPDLAIGHAILARASRHLGDIQGAAQSIKRCEELLSRGARETEIRSLLDAEMRLVFDAGNNSARTE